MPQSEILKKIIQNMESVIVGKRRAIELALITLLSDGPLLLEDVPGVGKTTLGKALAQSVQCSFARIQFTPDTLPGDVIGMSMYQMQTGKFSYVPGAVMNDMGESVELADRMLAQVYALLRERNIIPNAVQEQMLTSHVRAMAHRSVTGEPLPEVDASLFDEISAESMALARDVVAEFGNLPEEEAWLLSVHFEVAKDNL